MDLHRQTMLYLSFNAPHYVMKTVFLVTEVFGIYGQHNTKSIY